MAKQQATPQQSAPRQQEQAAPEPRKPHAVDAAINAAPGLYKQVLTADLAVKGRKNPINLFARKATEALALGELDNLTDAEKDFLHAIMVFRGYTK